MKLLLFLSHHVYTMLIKTEELNALSSTVSEFLLAKLRSSTAVIVQRGSLLTSTRFKSKIK